MNQPIKEKCKECLKKIKEWEEEFDKRWDEASTWDGSSFGSLCRVINDYSGVFIKKEGIKSFIDENFNLKSTSIDKEVLKNYFEKEVMGYFTERQFSESSFLLKVIQDLNL